MRENVKQSDWAGLIPTEWEIAPLKSQFLFNKGLPITKADLIEEGLPVISYGQIHSKECIGTSLDERLLRHVDTKYSQSHPSSKTIKGDIIIADTSEDLDGCGNAVLNDKEYPVFAGYHTIILKNVNINNSKYFAYLLRTDAWRSQIRKQLTEVKLFSITQKTLRQVEVLIPDIEIQNSIVNYLDNACSKIDEAISRHRQIIEKLEEYRKAVITKEIREICEYRKIKHLFRVYAGATPKSNIPEFWDGAINWITPADYKTSDKYISGGARTITEKGYQSSNTTIVPKGSIIISKRAPIGSVGIANIPLCTNQGCLSCVPSREVDSEFYYYVLSANTSQMNELGSGTTFQELSATAFLNMKVPYITFIKQKEIAEVLNELCTKANDAITHHRGIITKLEEYRKSLIYNAVTGKIDCRDIKS